MARLTKKARRAAALKGWRNRKRNPSMRQRWDALKGSRRTAHPVRQALRALKPGARLNPPSGWIPARAVKITRKKNGAVEVRIRRHR
jgi:DNA-binding transcriptional MocR family regulator